MSQLEIEAALDAAFKRCEMFSCPLSEQQKRILLQAVSEFAQNRLDGNGKMGEMPEGQNAEGLTQDNPLDQLTTEERQALLMFVKQEAREQRPWKTTLLNDWVQERDSGAVQFIRDRYGIQWLGQIQPFHLAQYDSAELDDSLRLKVGDRIEVTNGLWEWVQEDGPCSREWFACTVISIREPSPTDNLDEPGSGETEAFPDSTSCIVRFDAGAEYEIQGVYDWNRPNWRWLREF